MEWKFSKVILACGRKYLQLLRALARQDLISFIRVYRQSIRSLLLVSELHPTVFHDGNKRDFQSVDAESAIPEYFTTWCFRNSISTQLEKCWMKISL